MSGRQWRTSKGAMREKKARSNEGTWQRQFDGSMAVIKSIIFMYLPSAPTHNALNVLTFKAVR